MFKNWNVLFLDLTASHTEIRFVHVEILPFCGVDNCAVVMRREKDEREAFLGGGLGTWYAVSFVLLHLLEWIFWSWNVARRYKG